MKILPKNTCLGTLSITEIYEYYDGPKLFCCKNRANQLFLSYWCDSAINREYDGWLYLPISGKRLEKVRRGQISLLQAFDDAEEGSYLVYVYYAEKANDTAVFYHVKDIDKDYFPTEDFCVSQDSIQFVDKHEIEWNHDVRIIRDARSTNPSAEAVSAIIASWTSTFECVMNFASKSQTLYPVFAVPGSFEVKFNTSNNQVGHKSFSDIVSILNDKSLAGDALADRLYAIGLEVSDLKSIFDVMDYYKVELELSPKIFNDDAKSCYLRTGDVKEWCGKLEEIYGCVLSTNKIPQADELDHVIKILQLRMNCTPINEETFGLVDRQIRYYKDAAVLLGYFTVNGSLTSQGRYLLEQKDRADRMRLIASSFKSTDCAMSWKKWAEKESLSEVDPNSASDFILANVPGFMESTAKRRARTLIRWMTDLKEYL